MTGRSTP
jgi:hypothetical protein